MEFFLPCHPLPGSKPGKTKAQGPHLLKLCTLCPLLPSSKFQPIYLWLIHHSAPMMWSP